MSNGIYIGLGNAIANQRRVELLSNNLANVNTAGFQGDRLVFEEYLLSESDPQTIAATVDTPEITVSKTPPKLIPTGDPLDIATTGDSFVKVKVQGEPYYSRGGHLNIAADGTLRINEHALLGTDGVIKVPPGNLEVDAKGNVSVDGERYARISLFDLADNSKLGKHGAALYTYSEEISPSVTAQLQLNTQPGSNVDPIRGLIKLVEAQHQYTASNKVINAYRNIERQTNLLGKLR